MSRKYVKAWRSLLSFLLYVFRGNKFLMTCWRKIVLIWVKLGQGYNPIYPFFYKKTEGVTIDRVNFQENILNFKMEDQTK